MPRRARVGIDIGGTFTDLVLVDDVTGAVSVSKILTTPHNPAVAVADGFAMATLTAGVTADAVGRVVHGTTLVTNAVVERKGARTGLVTSAGFRDTLEIATENRYDMYDLELEKPRPLVERRLREEIRERIYADGRVAEPLDLDTVWAAAGRLRDAGVETVAVCLVNAYRNGEHERRAAELLRELLPGVPVTISSEVSPEIREYHRTVTTAVNAYVMPLVGRYVEEIARRLRDNAFAGEVFLMLSNGGICTVETARRFPVRLIESGPAAGALVAAHVGGVAGLRELLSFDMGGTTAKACFIEDGRPLTSPGIEVAHVYRFKQGSGFPLQVRSVELIEIGAGGGSIARVDALGLLRVGPESAGSDPGPACYGQGGARATVTDADLVLGYLDPAFFLGGKMALDPERAARAIETDLAPLGLSLLDAAWAVHRIVNENMASAARMHAIERGKNPPAYPLFAFGGAGPVHAVGVARILGASRVVVPVGAGVASAAGLLTAPFAFDFVRSYRGRLDALDWPRVDALCREMTGEGVEILRRAGVAPEAVTVQRLCAMRYVGQGSELEVALPAGPLTQVVAGALRDAFEATYRAHYHTVVANVPIEALTWRVSVVGPPEPLAMRVETPAGATRRKGERAVYFGPEVGRVTAAVYDRYALVAGDRFEGPAIVEERESTTVVDRDARVTVDAHGNLVIDLQRASGRDAVRAPALPAQSYPGGGIGGALGSARGGRRGPLRTINLDVLWNRLINTATEQRKVLLRTAFSTVLRESEDCAAGVFDVAGHLLAQAPSGTPGQINSMATCLPNFLEVFPRETLAPGDVLIGNHPWKTAGHLNDITVLTPVFRRDRLVGFFGSCAHSLDIGGRGFSSDSRSLYEEGLFIPFARLAERGRLNELLLDVIRHNVRSPELVVGDIMAQRSCNEIGGQRLVSLMDEFGLDDLTEVSAEIIGRCDRVMRDAIRRIPDGRYESDVICDGLDEPVHIHCAVTVAGDEILIDYAGSSPQVRWGINVPLCYSASYSIYALKCLLAPSVPNNAGTFRALRVTAPPGCIMNALPPAPVAGRHIIGNFQPLALYKALAPVLPEGVIGCSSVLWITTVQGAGSSDPFTLTFFASGGMGARPDKDGLAATSFPGNIAMTPVEMIEAVSPIVVREKALRPDSGGAGRFRGGVGQTFRFTVRDDIPFVVNTMCDQIREAPYGLAGGKAGAAAGYEIPGVVLPQFKAMVSVPAGGEVVMTLPGAGGYGDPHHRDPALVLEDVRAGLVTPACAREDYGVAVSRADGAWALDPAETARLRGQPANGP